MREWRTVANPYCLAMVICDAAHRDPATGKFSILGTFSSLASPSYPSLIRFVVYFAVTDGIGLVALRLQLIEADVGLIDAQNEDGTRIYDLGEAETMAGIEAPT